MSKRNITPHYKTFKAYNIPGHAHYLTLTCYKDIPLLARDRSREWFVQSLRNAINKHELDLWSFVIMRDHVHILFLPRQQEYDMATIRNSIKTSVTIKAIHWLSKNAPEFLTRLESHDSNGKMIHRFWTKGPGYDSNLHDPQKIWNCIDYIHNNPVRKGYCGSGSEWKWSSAGHCVGRPTVEIPIAMLSLPLDPR